MRIYDLMLFLFIFNYVLGMFVSLDIGVPAEQKIHRTGGFDESTVKGYAGDLQTKVDQANTGVLANLNYLVESVKLVILALPTVIKAFLNATIMFPVMLLQLHIPGELVVVFTAIVWLIYMVGVAQLISGRNMKEGA